VVLPGGKNGVGWVTLSWSRIICAICSAMRPYPRRSAAALDFVLMFPFHRRHRHRQDRQQGHGLVAVHQDFLILDVHG